MVREIIGEYMENSLEVELDEEPGFREYDYRNKTTDNSWNGHISKKQKTSYGEIETPNNRMSEFEPQLVKKQTSVSRTWRTRM